MNKIEKSDYCDLCKSDQLEHIYSPETSIRLLKVFICSECGLVQSFPKIDHVKTRKMVASGGADWGNIRYGKGFRTDHNISMINKIISLDNITTCIDIGANRGNFLLKINQLSNNKIEIWGIEPDSSILKEYSNIENFNIINDRIENVDHSLPKKYFDLVYCSHTIEHLKSPFLTLMQIRDLLKDDGIAYLEVPNIEFLQSNDIIEEWFIDKHLYHFSIDTFEKLVKTTGFKILSPLPKKDEDIINISMVVQPDMELKNQTHLYSEKYNGYQNNKNLIENYIKKRKSNVKHIKKIAQKLNLLSQKKRLAIWGAGRIFDILVKVGGLKTSFLCGVIDKHLSDFITKTNNIEIFKPIMLQSLKPDIVFISSREYFDEISEEIIDINPDIEILGFSDEIKGITNG